MNPSSAQLLSQPNFVSGLIEGPLLIRYHEPQLQSEITAHFKAGQLTGLESETRSLTDQPLLSLTDDPYLDEIYDLENQTYWSSLTEQLPLTGFLPQGLFLGPDYQVYATVSGLVLSDGLQLGRSLGRERTALNYQLDGNRLIVEGVTAYNVNIPTGLRGQGYHYDTAQALADIEAGQYYSPLLDYHYQAGILEVSLKPQIDLVDLEMDELPLTGYRALALLMDDLNLNSALGQWLATYWL